MGRTPLRARRDYGASSRTAAKSGDVCEMDASGLSPAAKDVARKGKGKVVVENVVGGKAVVSPYGDTVSRACVSVPMSALKVVGRDASSRTASDAMGFLALQMAEEHIDMRWTTAEKGWKVQAKKNLMLAKENWNAGAERMEYVFKTFAKVTEPGFDIKRIDSAITVTVSEQSKEL